MNNIKTARELFESIEGKTTDYLTAIVVDDQKSTGPRAHLVGEFAHIDDARESFAPHHNVESFIFSNRSQVIYS